MNNEFAAPAAHTSAKSSNRIFLSVVLLGVVALAVAIWVWQVRVFAPERAQVRDALASSDRAYTGMNAEVLSLRQQLADLHTTAINDTERLTTLEADLATLSAQMAKPTSIETNLIIARVAHLVAIADAAVRFEGNPDSAASALSAAAEFLATTTDTTYDALESAVHNDRQALLAVTPPDVSALALHWAEATRRVATLSWRPISAVAEIPTEAATMAGWQGVAVAIWRDLKGLVEVRDLTVADESLLDPGREGLIKEQIRTELAALRLAVYRRDSDNAKASAGRVSELLKAHFDLTDPTVTGLQQSLDELSLLDLAPPLPDLAATHTALDYLQRSAFGRTLLPEAPLPTDPAR